MVERLAEISRNADIRRNSFVNRRRVEWISSIPEPSDPAAQVQYLFMLGNEQLLAGDSAASVDSHEKLLKVVAENEDLPFTVDAIRKVRMSLAIAYLRLSRQDCLAYKGIDCSLLPILSNDFQMPEQISRKAIAAFTELLDESPDDLGLRWLLNIAYMTVGSYPSGVPESWRIPVSAFESDYDIGRFHDVAPQLGLHVFGSSGGSIMDDFTGDGYLDIMASGFGLDEQVRFFVNNRDGSFTERTREAELTGIVGGLNLFQADYNNDGRLDLVVMRGAWLQDDGRHPNSLLRNDGPGTNGHITFTDITEQAGLLSFHPTKVGAWSDYDNDGWLDLFVGNESTVGKTHPAELFHNNGPDEHGNVTFTEVARESGVDLVAFIKGAVWGDIDNDGLVDLYVSNLSGAGPNFLFHNRGRQADGSWRFVDIANAAGANGPRNSFPTWFFDYNNDGWLDIFVSGYRADIENVAAEFLGLDVDAEFPRLYRNNGVGAEGSVTFSDTTHEAGLETVLLTMGTNFGDLDNDGYLDFYAGTGDTEFRSLMPNRMFRNDAGRRFQDVTTSGGFGHLQKGHGVSFGDIDHDGDQDIYTVMGGAHDGDGFYNALYENPGHGNRWIALELEGVVANRSAIGARIKVVVKEGRALRAIYATVGSGGSFGASSLRQEIGLGKAKKIVSVTISWPGGKKPQVFKSLKLDRFYRIRQGDSKPRQLNFKTFELVPAELPARM
jgi:hypothetical protein